MRLELSALKWTLVGWQPYTMPWQAASGRDVTVFDAELANPLFIIARVAGLVSHAHEERERHGPMRQIDPAGAVYDGPSPRRLPETRK